MTLSPETLEAINAAVTRAIANIAPREQYLTSHEAAAVMRMHPHTVLRLIRDGKLRAVGSERQLRIPHSGITEYFTTPKNKKKKERA